MRRKVEHERRALRRQAQRIAGAVVGFVVLQAVFARGWVEPYSTPTGQLVLAHSSRDLPRRIRADAVPGRPTPSRSPGSSPARTTVTEIASYKPRLARDRRSAMIAFMLAVGLPRRWRCCTPTASPFRRATDLASAVRAGTPRAPARPASSAIGAPRSRRLSAGTAAGAGSPSRSLRRGRDLKRLTQDLAIAGAPSSSTSARPPMLGRSSGFSGRSSSSAFFTATRPRAPVVARPWLGVGLGRRDGRGHPPGARRQGQEAAGRVPPDAVDLPRPGGHVDAGRPRPRRGAAGLGGHRDAAGPSPTCRTRSTAPGSPASRRGRRSGSSGERFGIRELTDLDAALRLANEDGAKVRATLVARAEHPARRADRRRRSRSRTRQPSR